MSHAAMRAGALIVDIAPRAALPCGYGPAYLPRHARSTCRRVGRPAGAVGGPGDDGVNGPSDQPVRVDPPRTEGGGVAPLRLHDPTVVEPAVPIVRPEPDA